MNVTQINTIAPWIDVIISYATCILRRCILSRCYFRCECLPDWESNYKTQEEVIQLIWGDKRLKNFVNTGVIEGSDERFVNPASINLRLGDSFIRPVPGNTVTLGGKMQYESVGKQSDGTTLIMPGEFMLATTMERVSIPTICAAFVQGRSSIGRIGLMVQNAGFVDPGFSGHITLELKNDSPCAIILRPGYPVAQLIFIYAEDVSGGYNGKYQNQIDATGSRMYLDDIESFFEGGSHAET